MKKCPKCGAVLYPINSTSNQEECLTKGCGYSTISKVGFSIFVSDEIRISERKASIIREKKDKVTVTNP